MGLFLGLAAASIAGLILVLSFVWNGRALAANSNPNSNGQVANQPSAPQPSAPQPTPAQPVKAVSASDHIRGNKNAKVTLIEYSDFECPYCKRFEPTVEQALKDYPNDVRLVYRHYPLSFHQNAEKEAEASECAAKLGGDAAFWKYHDKIYAETTSNGTGFSLDRLVPLAGEIGLDKAKFQTCLDSGQMKAKVDADYASGNDAGVEGTPATFVNGQLVSGAVPYDNLKAAIEAAKK
ncbi:MAG TPA: thioredoxin domain-containing protein [Patescibacteria group bacterium]|nr:thioredoxin domain-containing protein [Patescibacteria group bacterium]